MKDSASLSGESAPFGGAFQRVVRTVFGQGLADSALWLDRRSGGAGERPGQDQRCSRVFWKMISGCCSMVRPRRHSLSAR
jgi:hypothetical protein